MLKFLSNLGTFGVVLATLESDINARYGLEEKKWSLNPKLLPYPFNIAEINSEADWEECRQIFLSHKSMNLKKKGPMKSKYSWILYKGVIDKTPEPPPKKPIEPLVSSETNHVGWTTTNSYKWKTISVNESNATFQSILEIIDVEKEKLFQGTF